MLRINTDRLLIRNFLQDDWKELQEIIEDKESSEYAIYDHQFPTSENEVKQITGWFAQNDDYLAICELSTQKVIGYLAINDDKKGSRNLGYNLHSAYQRKGYAYEACITVLNYAFNTMGVDKFTSGTANLNYPSINLLIKLGFHKTGESAQSFRTTPEGNPVEFTGSSFLLEKKEWKKQEYASF
jgi:RimJ/RimL family protein N-acetyltransferase